jgi:hypothetical protein
MGGTIELGGDIYCHVRIATAETLFRHLETLATRDPEIASLMARRGVFEATGMWSFAELPARALLLVKDVAQNMAADPVAASPEWNPEWRTIFISDLDRFLARLTARIDQFEAPERSP